jgi:excisionase family DNA binding protein
VDSATAAKLLSISKRMIWTLQASGALKPVRIGRAVRFSVGELERFIAERQATNDEPESRYLHD